MANVTKLHKKKKKETENQNKKSKAGESIKKLFICFQTRQPQIERNKLRYLPNYFSAVDIN